MRARRLEDELRDAMVKTVGARRQTADIKEEKGKLCTDLVQQLP